MKSAVTLIEIIVTLVILIVVVAVTIPSYSILQERAKDKEAIGNLRRIQEAEKFYFMQTSNYYPSAVASVSTLNSININLKVMLPTASSRDWNYTVYSNGCARSTRTGASSRDWYFRINDDGRDPSACSTDSNPESDGSLPNTTNCYTCP